MISKFDPMQKALDVAVVFGTYNRINHLMAAVQSVREAAGKHPLWMIVVDGGSTDGSVEWLKKQDDVDLIEQQLPLTGAVKAFNIGFGRAVDLGFDYICHFNDDAKLLTPKMFDTAISMMEEDPRIGEVAFEFNLRGPWGFEHVNSYLYANFGLVRREAGMQVAEAQGDPTGRDWWNPLYRTYGADCEFGMHLWSLGWKVAEGQGLRVDDLKCMDSLRELNDSENANRQDSQLFWYRFNSNTWGLM